MKKNFIQKLLCLTLSVCFFCTNTAALSANTTTTKTEVALPSSVPNAPSEPAEVPSTLTYDGVTYYNANSENFASSPQLFIKDLLNASYEHPNGFTLNLFQAWNSIGNALSHVYGSYPDHTDQSTSLKATLARLSYIPVNNGSDYSSNGDTWDCYNPIGQIAYSMSDAQNKIRQNLYDWYRAAGGSNANVDDVSKAIQSISDDTTDDLVYYNLVSAHKISGSNKKGHYKAYAVYLHDFELFPIYPEDSDNNYVTMTTNPSENNTIYASTIVNNTGSTDNTASQTWTDTSTITESSVISGSKAYSFEESLSVGIEKNFGTSLSINATVGFSASQTMTSGWSNEKGLSETNSISRTVGVSLPPYTQVMMKQNNTSTTEHTWYNCPVGLNYQVTIVEYFRDPNSNDGNITSKILGTFGIDADVRQDFYNRTVTNRSQADKNNILWTDLGPKLYISDVNGLFAYYNSLFFIADSVPMSAAGAYYSVSYDTVTSEISNLMPVAALTDIRLTNGSYEYTLDINDTLSLSSLKLEGLNTHNAPYYGFDQNNGYWKLVDASENILSSSGIAKLTTDITKATTLTATGPGTVYVKYFIHENTNEAAGTKGYATAANPQSYTKNSAIDSVILKIHVIDDTPVGPVPEPDTEAPEPTTETPEPTTEAPEPTTETPEPTTETPQSDTEAPEPTTEAPQSDTEAPEPTTGNPADTGSAQPAAQNPADTGTAQPAAQNPADTGSAQLPAVGASIPLKNGAKLTVLTSAAKGTGKVSYTAPKTAATKITVPSKITYEGKTYQVTAIAANAFKNNKKLKTITISGNITSIGANAFSGCTALTTVKIGNKVTSIGAKAFYGCKKLKTVTIGKNVTTIGNSAFANCTALQKITIPAKVTKIGKQAFAGDKKLKTITIKSTKLKSVGTKAFKNINSKAVIKVPKKKLAAYTKLLKNKGQAKTVKIKK